MRENQRTESEIPHALNHKRMGVCIETGGKTNQYARKVNAHFVASGQYFLGLNAQAPVISFQFYGEIKYFSSVFDGTSFLLSFFRSSLSLSLSLSLSVLS